MSFMAKRLLKKFKKENYKVAVNHSFLHPNQEVTIFTDESKYETIYQMKYGQIVTLMPTDNPDNQIMYFHGGAFTVPMNIDQLEMITKIAIESNSLVQIVDFPLLPNHTSTEILESAQEALDIVYSTEIPTFIVADSAGAAIALQLLIKNPIKISGTSFISPWLDMQLKDPEISTKENKDVMLSLSVLRQIGKQFEAGLHQDDWFDIFDPQNLNVGSIQIFYGENELLTPINLKFIRALKQADKASVQVTAFKDGFHDYTLWFKLPETKKTFKEIARFVRGGLH
ncbi:alpha/beta hydrolase fold domain-containing protein [Lentilactobacillus hilgardii]|uniref:alpha/beta hydrolase fold domain-containing protein n=1 Tax=Lentilactobacillus hilgardii TaxID=1588 RepID=UPI0021C308E2|nr:alpha/beta hydrolase [Lentilactobacillus hilgardii]MCP9332810.1 alpha/beta hydrolase [Lentilactobacillus hilgardii]MCP9349441.1 alpha/beta hydrolase [Lentilactobacillus hilgardii]MCP9352287.1 alpha/beta hydrolase [Lentilactobacillus hilgardii]